MGSILNDNGANARHRIQASQELRAISANGPEAAATSERFNIVINLGEDVIERYSKSRSICIDDPEDISTRINKSTAIDTDDPNDVDTATLAAITANKKDTGSGNPI
jgi:hypothetical protein